MNNPVWMEKIYLQDLVLQILSFVAENEKVATDIRQRGIRRREFERFITELDKLPETVSEFDDALWDSLVDYVTVGKHKAMVFTLIGGTEMKV